MAKIRVRVTREDIAEARKDRGRVFFMQSRICPIARAVKRVVGAGKEVQVTQNQVWVDGEMQCLMPPRCGVFVRAFDNHNRVKPFSFTISAPWLRKRVKKGKKAK